MTTEIWKNIPEYEGLYMVSSLGKIKSVERIVEVLDHRKRKVVKERILKPSTRNGYKFCVLSKENKTKTFSIHKLVAMTFLNRDPNNKDIVVDHIDNDRSNNAVSNLQLISHRENVVRAISSDLPTGVNLHRNNKWVSRISVLGKREYLGLFNSQQEASDAYQKRKKESSNYTFNHE